MTYGWPDLFVGNFSPRQDHIPSPDRLYVNMGGLYFRAATEYGLDVQVTASASRDAGRKLQLAERRRREGKGWA